MAASFFFYDLETTGIDKPNARIMQFAGQRTDMDLNPIGDPVNIIVKLTPDVVPEPEAILVTGLTPQQSLADGVTEAEFLKIFFRDVVKPDTIFLGFNSVRFDDEFMRYTLYRNFYDPYEWEWCNGCSRWDLLDMIRMTRALRPDGINWPFTPEGKAVNRLELLTAANGIEHVGAHNALSDVNASIAVARLIRGKHPKLFEYLLENRDKQKVRAIVDAGKPFVYTSGRYPSDALHTTLAVKLADQPFHSVLVYDLRHDPEPFFDMSDTELAEAYRWSDDPDHARLPVKSLKCNRCPAIAPDAVAADKSVQERLRFSYAAAMANYRKLQARPEFVDRVLEAARIIDQEREALLAPDGTIDDALTVDCRLYGAFTPKSDKFHMRTVLDCEPHQLADVSNKFSDGRLNTLLPLYKARNYSAQLDDEERAAWDTFCRKRLLDGGQNSRLARYFKRLQELSSDPDLSDRNRYLLEELQLYGESIMPVFDPAETADEEDLAPVS
jgi:exodeoxyribonuclease I